MKMQWVISFVCVGALTLLISCASQSIENELKQSFIEYIDACARGDIDEFRRLRARDEVVRIPMTDDLKQGGLPEEMVPELFRLPQ